MEFVWMDFKVWSNQLMHCKDIFNSVLEWFNQWQFLKFSCWYINHDASYNQWWWFCVVLIWVEKDSDYTTLPTSLSYKRWNGPLASHTSLSLPERVEASCLNWWDFTVLMSYFGFESFCLKIAKWLIWEAQKLEETLCDGKNKSQHAVEQLQSHKHTSGTLLCKPAVSD